MEILIMNGDTYNGGLSILIMGIKSGITLNGEDTYNGDGNSYNGNQTEHNTERWNYDHLIAEMCVGL